MSKKKSSIERRKRQQLAEVGRINSMSNAELMGADDLKSSKRLAIFTGEISDEDDRLGIHAESFKGNKADILNSFLRENFMGSILILSASITRAQALAYIEKFYHVIEHYFGALDSNPVVCSAVIDHFSAEAAKERKAAKSGKFPAQEAGR